MRYDFKVKFSDHILEDNIGQIICVDAILARDGTYQYASDEIYGDGNYQMLTVHRDWEEVRKLKGSLEGKPVIVYHTERGVDLDLDNIKSYKVGHLQNVRESTYDDYNVLIGDLFIDDKDTIDKIKSGELREISLGYFYDLDDSNRSQIKQMNMIAEHIALVDKGRAGISKILDSDDYYHLFVVDKGDPLRGIEVTKENKRGSKWNKIKNGIKYRIFDMDHLGQASLIPTDIIDNIIENGSALVFAVVDKEGKIVKTIEFGETVKLDELVKKGYNFEPLIPFEEPLDPYAIPDEKIGDAEEELLNDLVISLGDRIRDLMPELRRRRSNRGNHWNNLLMILDSRKELIKEFFNEELPKDNQSNGYFELANKIVNEANILKRKANDEIFIPLIVVTYDEESSEISYANNLKDAHNIIKKAKKEVLKSEDREDDLDIQLKQLNEAEGVFVMRAAFDENYDFRLLVVEPLSDDNVVIEVFTDLNELNRELGEYFKSVYDAETTINAGLGKYKKMSAILF